MSLLRNLPDYFREKKHFRNNGNSLTGELKHKSLRFSLDKNFTNCQNIAKHVQFFNQLYPAKYAGLFTTYQFKVLMIYIVLNHEEFIAVLFFSKIQFWQKVLVLLVIKSFLIFVGENVNYKPNTVFAIKKKKIMLDCLLQASWFTVCIFSWIGLYPL